MNTLLTLVITAALAGACIIQTPPPAPPPQPAQPDSAAVGSAASTEPGDPENAGPAIAVATSDDPRLQELYECVAQGPYPYMFKPTTQRGTPPSAFGAFTAGINGILYYGNLADCMGRLAGGGDNRVVGDVRPIALFAQIDILAAGDRTRPFGFYNPDIIRWGHETLIPPPDMPIGDTTAGELYRRSYTRFFRVMAESYLALLDANRYQAEQDSYWRIVADGKRRSGLPYLHGRFGGWLPDYGAPRDGTAMTAPMAIGFWLRRGIDGTDQELWTGLRKVLSLYDADWYRGLAARYPNARVSW